jgi:hypothetical protein
VLVYNSSPSNGVQGTNQMDDEEDKWDERGRLLDEEDETTA